MYSLNKRLGTKNAKKHSKQCETKYQQIINNNTPKQQSKNMAKNLTYNQLIEIANEFGTPVYIYHAERIAAQYKKLQKGFAGCNARFFYACKSLTNINICLLYTSPSPRDGLL